MLFDEKGERKGEVELLWVPLKLFGDLEDASCETTRAAEQEPESAQLNFNSLDFESQVRRQIRCQELYQLINRTRLPPPLSSLQIEEATRETRTPNPRSVPPLRSI